MQATWSLDLSGFGSAQGARFGNRTSDQAKGPSDPALITANHKCALRTRKQSLGDVHATPLSSRTTS